MGKSGAVGVGRVQKVERAPALRVQSILPHGVFRLAFVAHRFGTYNRSPTGGSAEYMRG